mmetsp:Transcript_3180/g.5784  ORF Transcript_3180/g.5784 Transcript_3180/m.5784 type:complete len:817 (-) Transcript_3180:194-2644(-)|eukprot:CAMPEP_0198294170 /NCGR_PEP_ID=MMETSP1449-20131203/21205_1 /TAXON_ID=420275 /ORGANISM="Attheya septentrionalis, Strain CCMP2084" /LENGTH=816 /DNA_ID=CAMNT_0043994047 /DNA_START=46 /DNA_END=2496 /DNA_ORIENTATION=+
MTSNEEEWKEEDSLDETGTQKHTLSLKDVVKHAPSESKAETNVLRSIEKQDLETGSLSTGILEGVPEDASHVFQTNAGDKKSPLPSTEPETVEEELFNLTNEMFPTRDQEEHKDANKKNDRQADAFADNADHLMKRARFARSKMMCQKEVKETYGEFKSFLSFRKDSVWMYGKNALIVITLSTGISCLLFYALNNPGGNSPAEATVSWWLLFIFVRQVITLTLAKCVEGLVIDFLCLRVPLLLKIIGPFFTLLLVQSKGWPFQLSIWGLINVLMLYGKGKFARHWLFYQEVMDIFTEKNQAGTVLEATVYLSLLILAIVLGAAVALKRFGMGLWYGQSIYHRYGKELASTMKNSSLIGKVAQLAKHKDSINRRSFDLDYADVEAAKLDEEVINDNNGLESDLLINTRHRDVYSGELASSQAIKIGDLLGEWEEPVTDDLNEKDASISAIVQFRTAASCMDTNFPFSSAFGRADKRERCIDSSQKLYLRLKAPDSPVLKFDTIAIVALKQDGTLNERVVKDLIRMFRPTRDGELTMLDFVKSIDTVYKDLRLIRSSIMNVQRMNAGAQRLWDVLFYFIVTCIVLAILGVNALALVGSLLALVVGLSFMVGSAFSKAFEGLLLVLVRKPYDVGDKIAVANCNQDASGTGSSGWLVKDVDLYNTTLVYGSTGEEATMTNGYLNQYRIINMNRSPKAALNFVMKFGIDVSKEKVEAFGKAVEQFVKDRPREWMAFSAYRLTSVEADLGFVEYKVVLQHRESWQAIGALLNSKSDVQKFAFELTKELDMGYEAPAMPIILSKRAGEENADVYEDPITMSLG